MKDEGESKPIPMTATLKAPQIKSEKSGDSESEEEPNHEVLDKFLELTLRLEMDRENKIETFEEIGMANPLRCKKSINGAID
jgi:hypothetical protein